MVAVSTLRYTERVEFNPTSTTTGVWSSRANDLYDPGASPIITGHQPRGFDNLMASYNNFRVSNETSLSNMNT